ncbi:ABC transporter substrate-binding protein [Glaciihabitans sp. dw_435]|uniref:ABC transporter substrate-binding protein n=1 Tax=Glaciihabitans sp. dw_435 TaxID=2720081 RepID=UPI0027DB07A3|nr:ABC transporter substrate-binding protein [Glaciihabitans sp. dw_435]
MKQRYLLSGIGIATAIVLAGCSTTAPDSSGGGADSDATITIGSSYEPQNLDNTAGGGQGVSEALNGNVYEGLFTLTDKGEVVNGLASDFTKSDDGLTYTFTLQKDVKFHSGDPLTATDVKYSIDRVRAETSKSSRKSTFDNVKTIATPDDSTVVITLTSKSISLPYNLSYVWIMNDALKDPTTAEDGTGPYKLGTWKRGSSLSLERDADYWGTAAKNKEVVFTYFTDATALNNALLTNAVDIVTSVQSPDAIPQFENNADYKVNDGDSTTKEVLAYNDRVAPFNNVKVRQAISAAIDKKKLLTSVWGDYGTLIGSFVPPTDPWYEDLNSVNAYDPAKATALLADAGYPKGFEFTLDTPDYDPHPIVAEFLKSELAKVGITVTINTITADEWYTKVYQKLDFQATLQEHVNHRDIVFYGNPDFYWGYNNPKVTTLIDQSETSDTTDEQTAKLKEANEIIANDAASGWLYLYPQIVVAASNVTGYPLNGINSQFFAFNITKSA